MADAFDLLPSPVLARILATCPATARLASRTLRDTFDQGVTHLALKAMPPGTPPAARGPACHAMLRALARCPGVTSLVKHGRRPSLRDVLHATEDAPVPLASRLTALVLHAHCWAADLPALGTLTALRHLALGQRDGPSSAPLFTVPLAAALAALGALRRLELHRVLVEGRLAELVPALGALTALEHLGVSNLRALIRADWVVPTHAPVLHALHALTALRHLELSCADLDLDAAATLGRTLRRLPALTHLDLHDTGLGDGGSLEPLGPALAALTQLRQLDLGDNDLGREDAELLVPALDALTALTHLRLAGNDLDHQAVRVLLPRSPDLPPGRRDGLAQLQVLDLRDNALGVSGTAHLARALGSGRLPALRTLHVDPLAPALDVSLAGLRSLGPRLDTWTDLGAWPDALLAEPGELGP